MRIPFLILLLLGTWWAFLGLVLGRIAGIVRAVFWPFADWFERRHAMRVALIGLFLVVISGAILGVLMWHWRPTLRLRRGLDDRCSEASRAVTRESRAVRTTDAFEHSARWTVNDRRSAFIWLDDVRRDMFHAARLLRRNPLMTITAALSLAVGIGANTAIFTVANALLLRPPVGVADPDRLVDIGVGRIGSGFNPGSYPTYLDIRQRATTLDGVYAHPMFPHAMSLRTAGNSAAAERIFGHSVTTNYFTVLGTVPFAGRLFGADDAIGRGPVRSSS